MAWKARIVTKQRNPNSGVINLNIAYFDDSAPAVVLAGHNFTFPAGTLRAEMLAEIREFGARVRERYEEKRLRDIAEASENQAKVAQSKTIYGNIDEGSEIALA